MANIASLDLWPERRNQSLCHLSGRYLRAIYPWSPIEGDRPKEKKESPEPKGKKKKKKKKSKDEKKSEKKEEKKERKEKKRKSSSSSEEELDVTDGRKPRQAGQKVYQDLFAGAGLDRREKVRSRVMRRARRFTKKKEEKTSTSGSTTSGSGTEGDDVGNEESIFAETNKLRRVSESFPESLSCQTLTQMRMALLQEIGHEDRKGSLKDITLPYYRQQLMKRCSGPVGRELLTLAAGMDALLRSQPARCMDLLSQRFKSIEAGLSGSHWTVAQRLELSTRHHHTHPQCGADGSPQGSLQRSKTALGSVTARRTRTWRPWGAKGFWRRQRRRQERKRRRQAARKGGEAGPQEEGRRNSEGVRRGESSGVDAPGESSGVGAPGKGIEDRQKTGVASPDPNSKDALAAFFNNYDGGWALAPRDTPSMWQASQLKQSALKLSGPAVDSPPPAPAPLMAGAETSWSEKKNGAYEILEGRQLVSCGLLLQQKLLEVLPLRSKSTGSRSSAAIFPLPTSSSVYAALQPTMTVDEMSWLSCLCVSLNSFWGEDLLCDVVPRGGRLECLQGLMVEVQRFCKMSAVVERFDWDDFFNVRSIDYRGEEVKTARWFSWQNVSPAFPKEIGSVPLDEVCVLGSRHYVQNFDLYLKPPSERKITKNPRVMVHDSQWGEVCKGLVDTGVCCWILEEDVFDSGKGPLLNGMFGVSKEEWTDDGTEIFRLIMNLIPLNDLCMPMNGDVQTLPSWGGMSPFFLQPGENLLVSSEDVKCFFYTMKVPECWIKYLAFNKLVPADVLPPDLKHSRVYIASRVLPMGFLNSISLAQHVHRNLVLWSRDEAGVKHPNHPDWELRKDLPFTVSNPNWRVYLDNYDLLERVQATDMVDMAGSCPAGVLALRQEYSVWSVPRNEKKAVQRSALCEVQGATIDGVSGVAYPKESKLAKYFAIAFNLSQQRSSSQKQWQVACGGLVYFSMFRRQLLGSLNQVWTHIEDFNSPGNHFRLNPQDCNLELLRFLGMLPCARMDFRLDVHPQVTCSDASTSGGGACVSTRLTDLGKRVAQGQLRGQVAEAVPGSAILSIGLFDGIGALRVALETMGVQVLGHVSVEQNPAAQRVVESHYPGTVTVPDVAMIDEDMVRKWGTMFSQACLVILGAGPPCQGVSGLNADRKGAVRDARSSLFTHVHRVRALLRKVSVWCPVHTLMESVRSMDEVDRRTMSEGFGGEPISCDAGEMTWCHRPRLYWLTWEICPMDGAAFRDEVGGVQTLSLQAEQDLSQVTRAGWLKMDPTSSFPTFTTSRPRASPGRHPAGIKQCTPEEAGRWQSDQHRFPPYQYRRDHCLVNKKNELRLPDVAERELMLGFPLHYTAPCAGKSQQSGVAYNDTRLTLLGNSWSVPVVSWLLNQLLSRLGLCPLMSPQDIMDSLAPGASVSCQGRLQRLPLNPFPISETGSDYDLAFKLSNLVSIKGEDIMLTTPSSQMCKFHRLRASVPGKLWKWGIVAGWKWSLGQEHINSLELRAILTTLKWRIEHRRHFSTRLLHLTDSQVCLRALSRGRSSSRKLRRTMARINSLVLAANVQPLWGYIDTHQNPADKPSRWGRRVRTKFRHAA